MNGPVYLVIEDVYFNFPEMMKEEKKDLIEFLKDEHIVYKNVTNKTHKLQQRYEQLQNNWNELKKWCKENQYNDYFDSYQVDNYTTYGVILKKMQEMEGE